MVRKKVSDLLLVKGTLPPPPPGVPVTKWHDCQMALKTKGGMPTEMVARLTTLRQINLYTWLVVILGHPWKWVMDREYILIDRNFKRPEGQA